MASLTDNIKVGKLTLAGRLVMPPMITNQVEEHDFVTEDMCNYYRERAKYSKVGLIITEHSYIHMQGKASNGQVSIAVDEAIPGFAKLAECVHAEGVKIIAQLNHAGSATKAVITGMQPVSASAVPHTRQKDELPMEMTVEQIHETVQWFVDAAVRVQTAGFDGVEIHSAHSYLLNQFYSPLTNHRTDEYGPQSIENRTLFQCEVIKAVREAVGEDFVVAIRLGGCDYAEGGSTVEDCVAACKLFEAAGADLIDLTGGMFGYIIPGHTEPGYFKDLSAPVKQAVRVPVLMTGGVTALKQAEALIEEGCTDLVGVGRAILKNAHWADEA